jgi:hypothetical protein
MATPGNFGLRGQLRDQGGQARKVYPTGHPLGPGGSWSGLGVVRGVQLGPWAAGFGGRLPRPAPGLAPLPLPRTGGCRPVAE